MSGRVRVLYDVTVHLLHYTEVEIEDEDGILLPKGFIIDYIRRDDDMDLDEGDEKLTQLVISMGKKMEETTYLLPTRCIETVWTKVETIDYVTYKWKGYTIRQRGRSRS
jgi:hypothetical protein